MGGIVISLLLGLFASQAKGAVWMGVDVVSKFASCPTYAGARPGGADFELGDWTGHWYEIERYQNWWEEGRCNDAQYTLKDAEDPAKGFDIKNSEIRDWEDEALREHTMEGEHDEDHPSDKANLRIWKDPWPSAQFLVVDTDYTDYAVVYSCARPMWMWRFEFLWIMSRTRTMSKETLESIHTKLNDMGIETSHLIKTDHTGCD